MKYKTKKTLKTILLSVLGVGAIVGAASGINTLVEKQSEELKTIHPLFEVGGLDTKGKFEDTERTIYTRQAFECKGLEIKLDFDNYINYQVFFYDENGDFISCTNVTDKRFTDVLPTNATHARLEVTPKWAEMGKDYDTPAEQVIEWYEVNKYASQLNVKVLKDQEPLSEFTLYYDVDEFIINYDEGMTWSEWFESDYNIYDDFKLLDSAITVSGLHLSFENEEGEPIPVGLDDVIDPLKYNYSIC